MEPIGDEQPQSLRKLIEYAMANKSDNDDFNWYIIICDKSVHTYSYVQMMNLTEVLTLI